MQLLVLVDEYYSKVLIIDINKSQENISQKIVVNLIINTLILIVSQKFSRLSC
jgi:hypothetical protein